MTRAPLVLVVAVPILAVGALAVGMGWDASSSPESKAFISTPQFALWLLILAAQVAVCSLALGFVGATVFGRGRDLRAGQALQVVASTALMLMFALVFTEVGAELIGREPTSVEHLPRGRWPLEHHELKVGVIVIGALLVGFAAVAGIWLIGIAFSRLAPERPPEAHDIEQFLSLRSDLNALLTIAGTIIGLGTLGAGALREAVLAANREFPFNTDAVADLEFAPGYVLAYGLFFTGLLAIAFAPSFLAMRAAGARLRDRAYPLRGPSDPSFVEVITQRRTLDELLQTNLSASATFRAGAAIITPLGGSLVSLLFPT